MRWPLFPPVDEFTGLNTQLVLEAEAERGAVTGGGAKCSSMFLSAPSAATAATPTGRSRPQGGGTLPVGQLPDGSYAVDTTPVEQAFFGLQEQNRALQRQLTAVEGRLRDAGLPIRGRGRGDGRGRGAQQGAQFADPTPTRQRREDTVMPPAYPPLASAYHPPTKATAPPSHSAKQTANFPYVPR